MKNLSNFKHRLKPGVKLHCTFHQEFAGRDEKNEVLFKDEDRGIREVSAVQSNSFSLKTVRADGSVTDSWCDYPAASKCKILDENTIQILSHDFRFRDRPEAEQPLIPVLTYKFVG